MNDLDLNLLRTLEVLLEERSVTRAARVLGRSQPAVSHALNRLRDAVGDPLFVREGRGLVPTPRAEVLGEAVRDTLASLARALEREPEFDPATSTRTFHLSAPDVLAPVLPRILEALAEAPGVRLELVGRLDVLGSGHVDVWLDSLPDAAPGIVARRLGDLYQAVVCRADHPVLAEKWDVDAWCRYPHVLMRTGDAQVSLVEQALAAIGRERTVGLAVTELLLIPHVVAKTDLLFTGPREILATLAPTLGLVLLEPPLPTQSMPVAAMWRERDARDPGHRWFRGILVRVLEEIFAEATWR